MFCTLCQKRGNPPATARGAWSSGELKIGTMQVSNSKTTASQNGTDAVIHVQMAEQGEQQSVVQLQCSAAAANKEQNHSSKATLSTSCPKIVCLLQPHMSNWFRHVKEGPQNAQYTSKFSAMMLLDAIDTWLDRKLMASLASSSYFLC